MRIGGRTAIAGLVAVLALAAPAAASAITYRGSGVDDPKMPVKVKVVGDVVTFDYRSVLVSCSDSSRVRQGGAVHSARLNARSRFRDKLTIKGATSIVRGAIGPRRASGVLTYDLVYDGGECHSGKVKWRAKRR